MWLRRAALPQAYLAARLDLFISHIGVLNLNVATTLSAIFKANPILSRRCINISILRRFVTLLMTYGEKKRTRWLSFLHNTVVVDGTPSPANQSAVLNLVRPPACPPPPSPSVPQSYAHTRASRPLPPFLFALSSQHAPSGKVR